MIKIQSLNSVYRVQTNIFVDENNSQRIFQQQFKQFL